MPVAPKQNANKDQPVNPRRSTRSSNKEVGVAKGTVKGAAAVNTTVKSKFYDHGTTRRLTCYLPETQKRKKADEPAEQPNKRPHTNNQVEEPKDSDNGKTFPVAAARATIRKAPLRPPLSLDSDGEENDHAGSSLDFSLSSNRRQLTR